MDFIVSCSGKSRPGPVTVRLIRTNPLVRNMVASRILFSCSSGGTAGSQAAIVSSGEVLETGPARSMAG